MSSTTPRTTTKAAPVNSHPTTGRVTRRPDGPKAGVPDSPEPVSHRPGHPASPGPVRRKPSPPAPVEPDGLLTRLGRAIAREVEFVVTPQGGWTVRRVAGRIVLGLIALSGPSGVVVVGSLVLLKERHHIARGIRAGIDLIHSRSHRGRRIPPSSPPHRGGGPKPVEPVELAGDGPDSGPGAPPAGPDIPAPAPSGVNGIDGPGGTSMASPSPAAPSGGEPSTPPRHLPSPEAPWGTSAADPEPGPAPMVEVDTRLELPPASASGKAGAPDGWQVAQTITFREPQGEGGRHRPAPPPRALAATTAVRRRAEGRALD